MSGPSQASRLVELAEQAGVTLFHTPTGEAHATFRAGSHVETHALRSKGFKTWLARLFFAEQAATPGGQAVQDALGVLDGMALFDGETHEVHVRLAEDEIGSIYLDLGNRDWQAVRIDAWGWEVVNGPPVKFRRPRGLGALPLPAAGGTIEELRSLMNVSSEEDWRNVAGWAVQALRPSGPYPVLTLHGEHGSAKSTLVRMLRKLIDPRTPEVRSAPRSDHDLMIAAKNGWVIALDNLSDLSQWLSDAICRLATGGGFGARQLYTDDEESIFAAQRPVILNGITEVATSADLLDRALLIECPVIPERSRRTEADLWAEFDKAHARALGALLDGVATASSGLSEVELDRLPRMADFARWATAAEPAFGWPAGSFINAYTGNRKQVHEVAVDSSIIGAPLLTLAGEGFEGTATELLDKLAQLILQKTLTQRDWPRRGRELSGELRRLAPNLRELGVVVTFDRVGRRGTRLISIRTEAQESVSAVSIVSGPGDKPNPADANAGAPSARSAFASAPNPHSQAVSDGADGADAKSRCDSDLGIPTDLEFDQAEVERLKRKFFQLLKEDGN